MHQFVCLKRWNRRRESERAKAAKMAVQSAPPLVNFRGQDICPVPMIPCHCPGVDPIPGATTSVFMKCSNDSCIAQLKPVHMDCFLALEEEMLCFLKHFGHKTSRWTPQQMRHNLWDKKGLALIERFLRCKCGNGVIIRDDDAWQEAQKELGEGKRRRNNSSHISECGMSDSFDQDEYPDLANRTPRRRNYTYSEGLF